MSEPGPVVSDASPIIAFERIGRLDLLRGVFESLVVPPRVAREVFGSDELPDWVGMAVPSSNVASGTNLGLGEQEAISLACEVHARWIVLDDLPARRLAAREKLPVIGTVGILLAAKRRGLIGSLRPLLDALDRAEFRLSSHVRELALEAAEEADA